MSHENRTRLLRWLDDGAPHVYFDMDVHLEQLLNINEGRFDNHYDDPKFKQLGECGTVCCIAGASHLMAVEGFNKPTPDMSWQETRDSAMGFLGLPADPECTFYGHQLFNPLAAPDACTPKQAATALRNVMEGRPPWN